jgi:hypothetical protein
MRMSFRPGVDTHVRGAPVADMPPVAHAEDLLVDCDGGDSLQEAVEQARPGDMLLVTGTCSEIVVLRAEVSRSMLDRQGTAEGLPKDYAPCGRAFDQF